MYITKTKQYLKEYKKKIIDKHLEREEKTIKIIEIALLEATNMKELINSNIAITYNIKKKKGNLKEFYTANINKKLRLYIKPIGEYPYDLKTIVEIELIQIDDKHYGDG